jgi:ubiquinone/menaquinone biosynthesis C-methylase UbiE
MDLDFDRYRKDWETNARVDPMWSVLSLPEKMGGAWQADEFYRIGEQEIGEVLRFMDSHGAQIASTEAALDFGSGLGRLTEALARRFKVAVGIDISISMIDKARLRAGPNIRYVLSTSPDLTAIDPQRFDFIYSNITLQHLNNDLQETYIREFARVLRPGGIAAFQIPREKPTKSAASIFGAAKALSPRRLAALAAQAFRQGIFPWQIRMELNVMTATDVTAIASRSGLIAAGCAYIDWERFYASHTFRLLEATPTASRYPISPLYFFRKVDATG